MEWVHDVILDRMKLANFRLRDREGEKTENLTADGSECLAESAVITLNRAIWRTSYLRFTWFQLALISIDFKEIFTSSLISSTNKTQITFKFKLMVDLGGQFKEPIRYFSEKGNKFEC
jgi:hypothetical protein